MNRNAIHLSRRLRFPILGSVILVSIACVGEPNIFAQAPDAPINASPEHEVRRMATTPEAPAPPSLLPEEIIKRFSQKEDAYLAARAQYGYRKTIRIDEFDREGKQVGQFMIATETTRGANGQVFNKVVERPQSTLHYFTLEPADVKELDRIPAFPITTSQLLKYDLKYLGKEKVDEIDAYIFQVKPKGVGADRSKAYFDGIVWVDTEYLEVVKTYGKWINELGDVHIANMPFALFETYRENVDGKYWFPSYQRSDDVLHLKDMDVPVRMVIKWTEFKLLPGAGSPVSSQEMMTSPGTSPATTNSPAPSAKPQ
jgi:hypothetical protein